MFVFRVLIDGESHRFDEPMTVLAALRHVGADVPTLCHDDRLLPAGLCGMCLVRVGGSPRPLPACATPISDGIVIETKAPELDESRRGILKLLAWRYPAAVAAADPGKPFHQLVRQLGLEGELRGRIDRLGTDQSHPYIAIDMSRCIYCYRCVRICDELQGQRVWHVRSRGCDTQIVPDGRNLLESSCVSCGACVDTCPTGALDEVALLTLERASEWTRTVCPYCGTGCEMSVGTRAGRIVSVRPVLDAPVNKGHLCVKGRYAFGFVAARDRITQPMIRQAEGWRPSSWNEARAFIGERLSDLRARCGPDSVGVLGSARATNEDNYVAQKFARVVIGTNNVDCCARVCHAPSAAALKRMLGAGLATNSFDDIEAARTILVCGANPTENHPIVGARIRQAARRGAQLIVIDPRRIELTSDAVLHLRVRPGTNVPLLNAVAHTIVAEELYDAEFLDARVSGVDEFRRFIAAWPPQRAERICDVDAESIRAAARMYATNGPAMSVHGLGLTEHVQGTGGVMALVNLALLTGNVGRTGAGVNPLRGQNNVQGAAHMGCDPRVLPGSTPIDAGREAFERVWEARLSSTPGLSLMGMMDAAAAGALKALWVIGYDVLLTNPNTASTARALKSLDLVIIQDLFMTETAREFGTVFLPACSSFEKEGTFMNAERRIQRVRAALRPLGESKPDWQIVCEVARSMGGRGFAFRDAEEIWNEVRALCPGARGMTYSRLDNSGLQWPCPDEAHGGTSILHGSTFEGGERAALQCVRFDGTPEHSSTEYPFTLITGRSLYQFNAGTMTRRTRNNELRPTDVLEITATEAMQLGLRNGEPVRVVSRYGSAVLPVRSSASVASRQLFATFQATEVLLNAVTGPHRDTVTGTPEYKVTAVRLERPTAASDGRSTPAE